MNTIFATLSFCSIITFLAGRASGEPHPVLCPEDLGAKASAVLKRFTSLSEILRTLYHEADEYIQRRTLRSLLENERIPSSNPTEVVRIRLSEEKIGQLEGAFVWLCIAFNPSSYDVRWISVEVQLTPRRSLKDVRNWALFSDGSVVRRVLNLKRFSEPEFNEAIVDRLEVQFQPISWPSSVIRGYGFGIGLSLQNIGSPEGSKRYSFGAFSALEPVEGVRIIKRLKGATAADELLVVGAPGEVFEAPEFFEW